MEVNKIIIAVGLLIIVAILASIIKTVLFLPKLAGYIGGVVVIMMLFPQADIIVQIVGGIISAHIIMIEIGKSFVLKILLVLVLVGLAILIK